MVYVNMGHDDLGEDRRPVSSFFASETQNRLTRHLLYWVAGRQAPRR